MRKLLALPLGGTLLALFLALPAPALAHERRDVGKYQFVVGFLNEPAFQNQLNGIDLTITSEADNKPVEGAEKTLKAEVTVGGGAKTLPLTLEPRFRMPGKYAAHFIPTASGAYIFRFSGTLEGEAIDQRFESGPGRFNDVQSTRPLEFPQKLADPASVQAQLADAQAAASSARMFGIAGVVVGLLGLILGGVALLKSRRSSQSSGYARSAGQA